MSWKVNEDDIISWNGEVTISPDTNYYTISPSGNWTIPSYLTEEDVRRIIHEELSIDAFWKRQLGISKDG